MRCCCGGSDLVLGFFTSYAPRGRTKMYAKPSISIRGATYVCFALLIGNQYPDSTSIDSSLSISDYRPLLPPVDTLVARIQSNIRNSMGRPAPNVAFRHLDDSTLHTLDEYAGSVVLLVFWNSSCPNCYVDVPVVNRLQKEYADAGLKVLYLSPDDPRKQQAYAAKYGIKLTKGFVNEYSLVKPYQAFLTPMAIVVDGSGVIREGWLGLIGYDAAEQRINRVIPRELKQWRWKREAMWAALCLIFLTSAIVVARFRRSRHHSHST